VAKAAIESGVAQTIITDWDGYKAELRKRMALVNSDKKYPYFIGNWEK